MAYAIYGAMFSRRLVYKDVGDGHRYVYGSLAAWIRRERVNAG